MATIRRLSDADVRSIFESLHGSKPAPSHLKFQIVPVGPNGLKLSPPSYEFEGKTAIYPRFVDAKVNNSFSICFFSRTTLASFAPPTDGLYVLLKPDKKRKKAPCASPSDNRSKVPRQLRHLLMNGSLAETCPWSLSGPQFPQPTAIQQRYCYPKGNAEYSSRKGGALWTMYGTDGKEDHQFRLLHVYFSAKRAVNKGMNLSKEEKRQIEEAATTPARKKRKTSTPSRSVGRSVRSPWQEPKKSERSPWQPVRHEHYSPMSRAPRCLSPPLLSSFDHMPILPPPSPCYTTSRDHGNRQSMFVSPSTAATSPSTAHHDDSLLDHPLHPVPSFDAPTRQPSPFRSHHDHPFLDLKRAAHAGEDFVGRRVTKDDEDGFDCDRFMNGGESLVDMDSYWNDPLFALVMKPSVDQDDPQTHQTPVKALGNRLQHLHQSIRDGILNSAPSEQGPLLSLVASWAKCVAQSPLDIQRQSATTMSNEGESPKFVTPASASV
jgi:hypothetical protein